MTHHLQDLFSYELINVDVTNVRLGESYTHLIQFSTNHLFNHTQKQ